MIVALAMANHNLPSEWHNEDPTDIATAVHILNLQQEARNG